MKNDTCHGETQVGITRRLNTDLAFSYGFLDLLDLDLAEPFDFE